MDEALFTSGLILCQASVFGNDNRPFILIRSARRRSVDGLMKNADSCFDGVEFRLAKWPLGGADGFGDLASAPCADYGRGDLRPE